MSKPPPPPRSVAPAAAPAAAPSGKLEELGADDILECDDIDALEAAAAAIVTTTFEVEAASPAPAPASSNAASFEVAELEPFSDAEVEGIVASAEDSEPEPTVVGSFVPPAPATSPMPLASAIAAEPIADRTLELKDTTLAKVEAAAAKLAEPDQTEVLVRSSLPPALQTPHGGACRLASTPPPAYAQPTPRRPGSIAPVSVDVVDRPMRPLTHALPAIPAPPRVPSFGAPANRGLSGLVIGGMAAAAVIVLGLVGGGGYAASRALSARHAPVSIGSSPSDPAPVAATLEGSEQPSGSTSAAEPSGSTSAADPSGGPSSAVDVSSLPTASPRGAARGSRPRASSAPAPSPAPVARSSSGTSSAPVAAGSKPTSAPASHASPGPAGAPLPPPPSPAPAAVPAVATTGVVHVDPGARVVVVDGAYRRASDGALTLACGSHRIKVGMGEQQTVNVPCGGSITVR